ncbi:MAG TPA: hypothetical protein VEH06_03345 [Candidatus Bathyarchaeia archaeon]|nr:hypothetical protein [Candidatus Bathyarchaeia archaeon]
MTIYSKPNEIERGMHDAGKGGRGVIMPMAVSYYRRTVMGEPGWGETLEDFYKLHNLDENRRKYLEDLRSQVSNRSVSGGPLNNLLNAVGLDY